MLPTIQEGIYYQKKPKIGNSLLIMSLRSVNVYDISEIGFAITKIWNRITKLKKGIISEIENDPKNRKTGELTMLVGYGPEIFDIPGSKRTRPSIFNDNWNFVLPNPGGGGPILRGSDIMYSRNVSENHLLIDHVLFQFIGNNEFYTKRAAIEVWKEIHKMESKGRIPLRITGLYTGFQRQDRRNWQGFLDGVSNLKSHDRPRVILIDPRHLLSQDRWLVNGTSLGFMRIEINLKDWEDLDVGEQEKMIGRDKITGCPLIGIDKNGKPIKDSRCPVLGTTDVLDPGNEAFRDNPPYMTKSKDNILLHSHIARTRPIDSVSPFDKKSFRIFRQGFEFLVSSNEPPGFIAGLNFVSFQNSPERLYRTLNYRPTAIQNTSQSVRIPNLNSFITVVAAGFFLVPPVMRDEPFPGARIFFTDIELQKLNRLQSMH
jgi:deferrochelatase/peroxidase EfeB